ncbi:hypothetical protein M409DRAFT_25098 [Zasmidium cellare ATCC 36951]|uniref:Opioid growth factor receptor (OGFr) conserved domain-containing protein n=1 Tax=Zasmidium cellare ATCC 36951 TaxID=1080233 RepID=A0A6A6CH12_ZASCE|nr:uncharacterized protein M409DRAFT_25098 [Zasmidium cellare ATCC 36951]KAF2164706.1 hypothetical protein M409DRAFT_25098 [Zasmidium cellare ATCC 36951]
MATDSKDFEKKMTATTTDPDEATTSSTSSADEEASKKSDDSDDGGHILAKSRPTPFIARFYGEEHAADTEGRTLDDICAFDDDQLEYHHDFIQVLFPLPERSGVNRDAPLIDKNTRDAFLEHEHLRKNLFKSFSRMARFYAFDVDGDEAELTLSAATNFKQHARNTWLTSVDHNHLRITRIIRCLRILGLDQVAQTFYQALVDNARGVSPRSLMYWKRAAKRPLELPPDQPDGSRAVVEWLKS